MKKYILIILVLFICFVFFYGIEKNIENMENNKKILFTCTSFISKPNKYESLIKTLDSFLKYTNTNQISKLIIINEYGENTQSQINKLKKKYPQFEFINKTKEQKGQAYSINMIIDILQDNHYDYWIHWEDSWILEKPFLDRALDIMDDNKVDQLQLIPRWNKVKKERKQIHVTKKNNSYIEIKKINDSLDDQLKPFGNCKSYNLNWENNFDNWPLFSLSPGIDKVDKIIKTGYFDNSQDLWPITFEFKWSVNWLCNGARKAVLDDVLCKRVENHESTYEEN